MADTVKLSDKALVTSLNDSDTVTIVDASNNVRRITVANFETARASTIATKVMAQMASGMTVSSGGYTTAQGGMMYTPDKFIGNSAGDGVASVILIAPFTNISTTESWRGCIGRFIFTRGTTAGGLRANYVDVVAAKAYNSASGSVYSAWSGVKAGYCTYNSQMYLALYLPAAAYFGISFSGRFSGNCVFTPVLYSAVSAWTDL